MPVPYALAMYSYLEDENDYSVVITYYCCACLLFVVSFVRLAGKAACADEDRSEPKHGPLGQGCKLS